MNFAILKNESADDHIPWIKSCENLKSEISYKIIDVTKNDWLEKVQEEKFDCFLLRPPDKMSYFKQLYDERVYIINKILNYNIYPSYQEVLIYENKRVLSYWLKANKIPHPETYIFYNKNEAMEFSKSCKYPIVAKTSIGAAGSGVQIIKTSGELVSYIKRIFSNSGVKRQWGVNFRKQNLKQRGIDALKNHDSFLKKIKNRFISSKTDPQRWHIILQEYVKCNYEWRAVRIGNSFFAHKKLKGNSEKFSGTSIVGWDGPSLELLNFVKLVTDKGNFLSQAVDIFEPEKNNFLVNELQCFFGSKNPHQMIINDSPARYIYENDKWILENGEFNSNNSFDLRLKHIIKLLKLKDNF